MAKRKPSANPDGYGFRLDKVETKVESHDKQLNSINAKMSAVQTDVSWLKDQFVKLDYRVWVILVGIIISILIVLLKG